MLVHSTGWIDGVSGVDHCRQPPSGGHCRTPHRFPPRRGYLNISVGVSLSYRGSERPKKKGRRTLSWQETKFVVGRGQAVVSPSGGSCLVSDQFLSVRRRQWLSSLDPSHLASFALLFRALNPACISISGRAEILPLDKFDRQANHLLPPAPIRWLPFPSRS